MHDSQKVKIDYLQKEKIILVGNPNVGKSVVFNNLTGKYVTVSNYPGTTVDISQGTVNYNGREYIVIDTPGINSIVPKSEDEQVTRDIILRDAPSFLLQVADAKNLKRALVLTFQLRYVNVPLVLDLNISDEAKERGFHIDVEKLSQLLDLQVIETVAITGEGMARLKRSIFKANATNFEFNYPQNLEDAFRKIENFLPPHIKNKRLLAFLVLSEDETITDILSKELVSQLQQLTKQIQANFIKPLGVLILEAIQKKADQIINLCVLQHPVKHHSIQEKVSTLSLRPLTGIPIMLAVVYIMYSFVGKFAAGIVVNFLESVFFGRWVLPITGKIINIIIPWVWLKDFLIGPYGLFSMALTYALAIIFPIVGAFFIFFGLLEDSGYLPRLSVMSDRIFRLIGLNGKAILPMVLGLGCGTMATLTARTLDTKKERLLVVILLSLGIPCSAQLGVVMGMLGGVSGKVMLIWLSSILTSLVLVGFAADRIIPGRCSLFVQEIPPVRWPQISNILIKTWARLKWYLKEAVPLFIVGTFVLFILDKIKILMMLEKWGAPLVENLLGLPAKATEAFLIGFLRRDYGAAGLYVMQKDGFLSNQQVLVSMVVITLFVPCIAQAIVTFKEYGWKKALAVILFVFLYAIVGGTVLNYILNEGIIRI